MTLQGVGLDVPSRSLGIAHLAIISLLIAAALVTAQTTRRVILAVGGATVVILPAVWVGPLWSSPDSPAAFALGFYASLCLGLAIPFALAVFSLYLLRFKTTPTGPVGRVVLVCLLYFVGLLASYPVSMNYALLYPLFR